jgi:hypothetical protein
MSTEQTLEKVYAAQNVQDAYLVKSLLEENGIESFIENENIGSLIPINVFVEVWVASENVEEAKRIIHEEYNEEPTDDVS